MTFCACICHYAKLQLSSLKIFLSSGTIYITHRHTEEYIILPHLYIEISLYWSKEQLFCKRSRLFRYIEYDVQICISLFTQMIRFAPFYVP